MQELISNIMNNAITQMSIQEVLIVIHKETVTPTVLLRLTSMVSSVIVLLL